MVQANQHRPSCARRKRKTPKSSENETHLLQVAHHAKSGGDDTIPQPVLAGFGDSCAMLADSKNMRICRDRSRLLLLATTETEAVSDNDDSSPRSCSLQNMRRRKQKIDHRKRYAWSLLLIGLTCVKVIVNCPFLFVVAEGATASVDGDDINTNTAEGKDSIARTDKGENERDNTADSDANSPTEDGVTLPASLMKATRVGAKLREVHNPQDQEEEENSGDDESQVSDTESPNGDSVDDVPQHTKPHLAGCHWGTVGCNKGKLSTGGPEMNSSSIETNDEDGSLSSPSSSLAGSATAKIEAHVMKGRGPTLSQRRPATKTPVWDRENIELNSSPKIETGGSGNKPPQGFKLAGRIVTSPSDGLSYFLDAPQVDPESNDGDWMMSIPYAYLECGPTIESTTEAFSLADMVLRNFPASASMQHWTNLGGGVTIEDYSSEGDKTGGTKYIDGNQEGYPKLLVALSPIEITVSGNNEETRIFNPGEVILMEDTLGKGHKMRAAPDAVDKTESMNRPDAHDRDLSVLMVSLPHTVHYPMYEWLEESSYLSESSDGEETSSSTTPTDSASASSPPTYGAVHSLFGFAPKHLHQKPRSLRKRSSSVSERLPCPLEYDSAYSSLFMPTHNHHRNHHGHSRRNPHWGGNIHSSKGSSFDELYPPPPGFSTYGQHSALFDILPSLRRTMLFGIGLSLTSSFIFCVQLLYPPLLVLWGGGTLIMGGALVSVLATRWGYRNWVANWEEEWRWKREVKRNQRHREGVLEEVMAMQKLDDDVPDDTLTEQTDADHGNCDDANHDQSADENVETDTAEKGDTAT